MKTLINILTSEAAATRAGKIINLFIIVTGFIYCVIGIVWQASKNL